MKVVTVYLLRLNHAYVFVFFFLAPCICFSSTYGRSSSSLLHASPAVVAPPPPAIITSTTPFFRQHHHPLHARHHSPITATLFSPSLSSPVFNIIHCHSSSPSTPSPHARRSLSLNYLCFSFPSMATTFSHGTIFSNPTISRVPALTTTFWVLWTSSPASPAMSVPTPSGSSTTTVCLQHQLPPHGAPLPPAINTVNNPHSFIHLNHSFGGHRKLQKDKQLSV